MTSNIETLNKIEIFNKELSYIKESRIKESASVLVELKDSITKIQKVTDPKQIYSYELITEQKRAPIQKGEVLGKVQVRDEQGNVFLEADAISSEEVLKASLWDLWKRNLKTFVSGN